MVLTWYIVANYTNKTFYKRRIIITADNVGFMKINQDTFTSEAKLHKIHFERKYEMFYLF